MQLVSRQTQKPLVPEYAQGAGGSVEQIEQAGIEVLARDERSVTPSQNLCLHRVQQAAKAAAMHTKAALHRIGQHA